MQAAATERATNKRRKLASGPSSRSAAPDRRQVKSKSSAAVGVPLAAQPMRTGQQRREAVERRARGEVRHPAGREEDEREAVEDALLRCGVVAGAPASGAGGLLEAHSLPTSKPQQTQQQQADGAVGEALWFCTDITSTSTQQQSREAGAAAQARRTSQRRWNTASFSTTRM